MTTLTRKTQEEIENMSFDELNAEIERVVNDSRITFSFVFVPFSQSRNKAEKMPSLNFKGKLTKGMLSIEADYSKGHGHCASYKYNLKHPSGKPDSCVKQAMIAMECETGIVPREYGGIPRERVKLSCADFVSALAMDSDVLNYSSFEDWASCFGYEEDSRKAEKIYNECLANALKMKAFFGSECSEYLQELSNNL
jgi:hypothetical protein